MTTKAGARAVIKGSGVGSRSALGQARWIGALEARSGPAKSFQSRDELLGSLRDSLAQVEAILATAEAGGEAGEILAAQSMIAGDPTLPAKLLPLITSLELRPEDLATAFSAVAAELRKLGGYIGERADDVEEIGRQVSSIIFDGGPSDQPAGTISAAPSDVLVTRNLSALEASSLEPATVAAIITGSGGPTGHVALILKAKKIPALVGAAELDAIPDGAQVFVDPLRSRAILFPSGEDLETTHETRFKRTTRSILAEGSVSLLANVGSIPDARLGYEAGAAGIGLLRTELIFLDRTAAPGIEEQLKIYREIAQVFRPRPSLRSTKVVFRTLDLGPDKRLPFISEGDEENPALGMRGIRLASKYPELLSDQLGALGQLCGEADLPEIWTMAPMVTNEHEVLGLAALARARNVKTLGAMIEVPAAAAGIGRIIRHLDFVSIGTNDLAQYFFAADRNSAISSDLIDPWDPGFLALVASVVRTCNKRLKPVGVCGETAADPLLAIVLVGLGVDSLSMAPASIPEVATALGSVSTSKARRLAQAALQAPSGEAAREALIEKLSASR